MSSIIAARDASLRTLPPYSAAAQRARSLCRGGDRAGAAGRRDDRGERHDRRAIRQVDRGQLETLAGEPVAVGDRPLRCLGRLVPRVVEPERREEARRAAGRPGGSTDGFGEHAEHEVVGVRVVPRRPGPGEGLADVAERARRVPDLPALGEQRLVDARVEVEVAESARVVEQLADRDRRGRSGGSAGWSSRGSRASAGRPRRAA